MGGGTLPQHVFKPYRDIGEAALQMRIISVQRLQRSFGTDKKTLLLYIILAAMPLEVSRGT